MICENFFWEKLCRANLQKLYSSKLAQYGECQWLPRLITLKYAMTYVPNVGNTFFPLFIVFDKYIEGCVYMHMHGKTIFGPQMIGAQTDESEGKDTSGKIRKMLSMKCPADITNSLTLERKRRIKKRMTKYRWEMLTSQEILKGYQSKERCEKVWRKVWMMPWLSLWPPFHTGIAIQTQT